MMMSLVAMLSAQDPVQMQGVIMPKASCRVGQAESVAEFDSGTVNSSGGTLRDEVEHIIDLRNRFICY